jgi:hypothetical protein
MNIIVSKIYDKQRFVWFMHLKYGYPLSYTKTLAEWIDDEHKYSFSNLTEEEVRYLQATNSYRSDSKYICKLKIIPTKMRIERERRTDISPQPGDELKQESLDLFHVKFTKVIHFDEMLNERQIQALLKDKNVKSINIDK